MLAAHDLALLLDGLALREQQQVVAAGELGEGVRNAGHELDLVVDERRRKAR